MNAAGASAMRSVGKTLARIAECGHTNTHLPHWVHSFSSHTGISSAMLRFSWRAVPVGQVPSTGSSDTGRASPLPLISGMVTRRVKASRPSATIGAAPVSAAAASVCGTSTR